MQQNNDFEHNALNARKRQSIKQNDVYRTKDDNKCTKKKKKFWKVCKEKQKWEENGEKKYEKNKEWRKWVDKKNEKNIIVIVCNERKS